MLFYGNRKAAARTLFLALALALTPLHSEQAVAATENTRATISRSCDSRSADQFLNVFSRETGTDDETKARQMRIIPRSQPEYEGQLHFTLTGLPRFEDYPASNPPPKTVAPSIDWSSHPDARTYRTALTDALNQARQSKGKLVNGHYALVTVGCGTNCQGNWIVNVETGRVLGSLFSSSGVLYRTDSALLIAGDYLFDEPYDIQPNLAEMSLSYPGEINFYLIANDTLSSIKRICFDH